MLRLAFFGSDEIALPCLNALVGTHAGDVEIVCVFSQPDRPQGRGQKLQANAVVEWARRRGLPVFQPEKPDETHCAQLQEMRCDAALVMAYGHILKNAMLASVPLGFFNLHASLLPALRGATPIEGAIISGLTKTGVTLQRVVAKLDAGAVIDAEEISLSPEETRLSLREKVAVACVPLIARALPAIAANAPGTPQNESIVSFTRKITREDSATDFSSSARELAARTRALSPWPGTTFPFGEFILKIGESLAEENSADAAGQMPGTIITADSCGVRIMTGEGVLRITQLQRPGGKMLPAAAFLAGFPISAGTVIESKKSEPLVKKGNDLADFKKYTPPQKKKCPPTTYEEYIPPADPMAEYSSGFYWTLPWLTFLAGYLMFRYNVTIERGTWGFGELLLFLIFYPPPIFITIFIAFCFAFRSVIKNERHQILGILPVVLSIVFIVLGYLLLIFASR